MSHENDAFRTTKRLEGLTGRQWSGLGFRNLSRSWIGWVWSVDLWYSKMDSNGVWKSRTPTFGFECRLVSLTVHF